MNTVEQLFLSIGFSWTMSKLLPYILVVILGVLCWRIFKNRKFQFKSKLLRIVVFVLFFTLPFLGYFIYSPIYEGDFSNQQLLFKPTGELLTTKQELVVVTIPNCPFCLASIERMKAFKKRNPTISIRYVVCASDKEMLSVYKKEAEGFFPVELAKDRAKMEETAQYAFPTFILCKKGTASSWSNASFGVVALDEVEQSFY